MEILGIGPMELMLIVALALILLGPKDMAKAGKTIGAWLNNLVRSDTWKVMRETTKTVRNLPTQLMREANLEEMQKGMNLPPLLPKFEDMDAIRNAPEQYRAARPSSPDLGQNPPEAGAPETNVIAPPRSLAYAPARSSAAPVQEKKRKTVARKPSSKSNKPGKSVKSGKSRPPVKKSGSPKTKRGKKADA
jgi:sec-independent protein translocase protein TatB